MNSRVDGVGGSHASRRPDGTRRAASCPGERRLVLNDSHRQRRGRHRLGGGRLAEQLGQLSRLSYEVRAVLGMQIVGRRGTVDEHGGATRQGQAGRFARPCVDSCHGSRDGSRTCVGRSHICRRTPRVGLGWGSFRCRTQQGRFSAWGLKKEGPTTSASGSISPAAGNRYILTCNIMRTHRQVCITPYARMLCVSTSVGRYRGIFCAEGARTSTRTGMRMRRRRKIDERSGR